MSGMRRCGWLMMLLILFISACRGGETSLLERNVPEADHVSLFEMEVATVEETDLSEYADQLYAVQASKEHYIAVGSKGKDVYAMELDPAGMIQRTEKLETPGDYVVKDAGCDPDGNLSVLFVSEKSSAQETDFLLKRYGSEFGGIDEVSFSEKSSFLQGPFCPGDGSRWIWGYETLIEIDSENEITRVTLPADTNVLSVMKGNDEGQYYVSVSETGTVGIRTLEPESKSPGELQKYQGTLYPSMTNCHSYAGELYINSDEYLYEFLPETGTFEKRFSWGGVTTGNAAISHVTGLDHNRFAAIAREGNMVYMISSETKQSERTRIVIAAIRNEDFALERFVAFFNQQNEQYYAEVKYYDEPTLLIASMTSADPPDVIDLPGTDIMPTGDKFVDMMEFLEQDPDIGTDDIVPSMLQALLTDDSLLSVPSSIWIFTLVGRKEVFGEKTGLSIHELKQITREKGEDYRTFAGFLSSRELLNWFGYVGLARFIDKKEFKSHFDCEEFRELLEYCKDEAPENPIYDDYLGEKTLLAVFPIQKVSLFEQVVSNYGKQEITYVGFPSNGENNGSAFGREQDEMILAVPMNAPDLDGAWNVVKTMMSEGWQEQAGGIPLNIHVLERQMEQLSSNEKSAMTAAEIKKIWNLINETSLYIYHNHTIMQIIMEEADAYFAGAKDAEEVTRIIDSRVTIYLQEQN